MKVTFLSNPLLEHLGKGFWRVKRDFVVLVNKLPYIVPDGFKTDLDSIPRLSGVYWLVKGRAINSAVLHDWLYVARYPRRWADRVMYAAMETEGVHPFLIEVIYAGIRVGGWWAYRKKPKRPTPPPPPAYHEQPPPP